MADTIGKNSACFTATEVQLFTKGVPSQRVEEEFSLQGVVTDSRLVEDNNLFIALKGEKFDAHAFLPAIAQKSTAAAIVEHIDPQGPQLQFLVSNTLEALGNLAHYHRKRFNVPLIGLIRENLDSRAAVRGA